MSRASGVKSVPFESISFIIHPPTSRLSQPSPIFNTQPSTLQRQTNHPNQCNVFAGHHNAVARLALQRRLIVDDDLQDGPEHQIKVRPLRPSRSPSLSSSSSSLKEQKSLEGLQKTTSLFTASRDGTVREWDVESLSNNPPTIRRLFTGHSHWVNDVATIPSDNGIVLVTASNDKTLRVWSSSNEFGKCADIVVPTSVLVHHTDYVNCVTAAKRARPCLVASGGNDQRIAMWDLERTVPTITLERSGGVFYPCSVLSNTSGPVFVEKAQAIRSLQLSETGYFLSCTTGRDITIWDTRTNRTVFDIKEAHADIIRRFNLSTDGSHGISTAADGTVSVWDLRRSSSEPYKEIDFHSDSVWALWADPNDHSIFFTGDRQGALFGFKSSDLDSANPFFWMSTIQSEQIQDFPGEYEWTFRSVLDLTFDSETSRLWASTGNSNVACWDLHQAFGKSTSSSVQQDSPVSKLESHDSVASFQPLSSTITTHQVKLPVEPTCIIPGFPKLREFRLLRDQRTVVTQSLLLDVESYDIVEGTFLKSFGKMDFDDVVAKESPFLSVPSWCSLDIVLGCLRVTLKNHNAFMAEALEASTPESPTAEASINYGCRLLDRLFCLYNRELSPSSEQIHESCALVGVEIHRALPSDSVHDNALWTCLSCALVNQKQFPLPSWVHNWVVERQFVENTTMREVTVYFVPAPHSDLPALPRNRFECKRWTPVSKIASFITSTLKLDLATTAPASPSTSSSATSQQTTPIKPNRSSVLARPSSVLVLTCMGHQLESYWDIGTVKDLVWRKNQVKGKAKPFEIFYDVQTISKKGSLAQSSSQQPSNSILSRILSRKSKQGGDAIQDRHD